MDWEAQKKRTGGTPAYWSAGGIMFALAAPPSRPLFFLLYVTRLVPSLLIAFTLVI